MRLLVLLTVAAGCALGGCASQPTHDDARPDPAQLVPTLRNTGDATLPAFTPHAHGYTLLLRCEGGGSVSVRYNDERDVDTWPCDGVLNHSRVYTDKGRQVLQVRANAGSTWSAGVVDGSA